MKTQSLSFIASLLFIIALSSVKGQNINFTVSHLQDGLKSASVVTIDPHQLKTDSVAQHNNYINYIHTVLTAKDTLPGYQYTRLNLKTIGSGYRDAGKVTTSPLRWTGNDWLKVLAIGGGALALHQLDIPLHDMVNRNNTSFVKGFSNALEPLGNGLYIIPSILGVYGIGAYTHNEDLSGFAITAGKAVLITNTLVLYAKVLAHRHRPNDDTPTLNNQWDGPRLDLKNASFFSSHTATAFALATVISENYGSHKWVSPVAYTMASLIGVSRITGNDHWATDVFIGAIVGYSVGKLVNKLNRSKKIKLVVGL